jgi:hypothetical protein
MRSVFAVMVHFVESCPADRQVKDAVVLSRVADGIHAQDLHLYSVARLEDMRHRRQTGVLTDLAGDNGFLLPVRMVRFIRC